ncbi:hypothetical protein [Candidatus Nitrospira salsa]
MEKVVFRKGGNYSSFTRRSRQALRGPGGFLLSPLLGHPSMSVQSNDGRRSSPLSEVTRLGTGRMALGLKIPSEAETLTLLVPSCAF